MARHRKRKEGESLTDEKLPAPVNQGGQPRKILDTKLLYELAKIHCTKEEIAHILDCHVDTIYANPNYSEILRQGVDDGKRSLRRLQWEQALKGNIQMLIWLGKQWLGQKDSQPDQAQQVIINISLNEVPMKEIDITEVKEEPKNDS